MVDPKTIAHMTRNEADMAFKKRVQTIFEWIPPHDDARILDCACGRGFYLNMYRHVSRCELVGLELDADIIRKAQRNVGHLPGITLTRGSIYALPFPDNSIASLSCMHVVEHVGLGRYGDPLDPDGDLKAARELSRVLAPGGSLLFVVPVGAPRVCFNAHRVYSVAQVKAMFPDLGLKEFSLIPDNGREQGMIRDASEELAGAQSYGCGCFRFEKTPEVT